MKIFKTMKIAVSEKKKPGIYLIIFTQLAHINAIVISQLTVNTTEECASHNPLQ